MNVETTIKYLSFVSAECERYLVDEFVSDEELNQLIIEFNRFQSKVKLSNLPIEIKNDIQEIKFEYNADRINRSTIILIIIYLTFGGLGYLLELRRQYKRKRTLDELKRKTSSLVFKLKLGSKEN